MTSECIDGVFLTSAADRTVGLLHVFTCSASGQEGRWYSKLFGMWWLIAPVLNQAFLLSKSLYFFEMLNIRKNLP
jgi:hypothetical protein